MTVHLRARSHFSFLDALPSPQALARTAAEDGAAALGLTDRDSLTGAIEFYDACREQGIRPILGLEIRASAPAELAALAGGGSGVLALYAMDMTGWSNLCRLASLKGGEDGEPLPFQKLEEHNQGLICLGGGRRGLTARFSGQGQAQASRRLLGLLGELFPGRLYVELQRQAPEDELWVGRLARLAKEDGLPLVATHTFHYLEREQARLQRVVTAIRLNRPLAELPAGELAPPEAHFIPGEELNRRFEDLPEAIANTAEIAQRCRLELPLGVPHFPELSLKTEETAIQVLRERAYAGANKKYGPADESVWKRLAHELKVIEECGYAALFLIMEEILAFARDRGVPIASRGSASSSLVAHCLGLTDPDPVRLNLYFERFLNPARATPPDIDTDLCSRRRDEVIRFVYERFGAERVAMVCTINRFRRRSALRETAKAYGLPPEQINRMVAALPERWYGPPGTEEAGGSYAALSGKFDTPLHQAVLHDAESLIGLPHHLSVHPGGMVIAPGPITDLAPTQVANKGVVITAFDLDSIERLGLVKIDLLGIRGLSVLGDVAEALHRRGDSGGGGPEPAQAVDVLREIPEDDPQTQATVRTGRTIGCFQIESPGMRLTLKAVQADSVDDIMAALALYRPGPLVGGSRDAFVRRHRGEEPASYLHPALAPVLADTHGLIIYQEQVLRIANELAGLSLADADLLRRAMSHFDPGKQMQTLKEKFLEGALKHSGVPEETAGRIWELMAAFAGYGFPKAHAASYAQVGWRAAWCKTHHPALFMAAVLANWGGYYSQRVYLMEARRLGLSIKAPHVNYAGREFGVRYLDGKPVLFMGLDQVKGLTRQTQRRILNGRPFHSLDDFLARVDPRRAEAENLARAGALEGFGVIPALLRRISAGGWLGGQLSLFSWGEPQGEADWSLAEKAAAQEEILGVSVVAHPLELGGRRGEDGRTLTTVEAVGRIGKEVCVAGMRQTWRRSLNAQGEFVYYMMLEDLEGMIDVVIPAAVYRLSRAALETAGPYYVEGLVDIHPRQEEPVLIARKIEPF